MHEKIIILDFGGQYAHLIASRIRREKVLSEIHQPDEVEVDFLKDPSIKGIILSGGPQSVYDEGSASVDPQIFELGKPVLGICYGHQFMNQALGGKVVPGQDSGKEFGRAELTHNGACPLFKDIPATSTFWMSHGDEVETMGEGFTGCGDTALCPNAAVWHEQKNLFGIQFHPEVTHSEYGAQLLKNFVGLCGVHGDWTMDKFLAEHEAQLKMQLEGKHVVLFVSGGVDSTVAFALLSKVLGPDRVQGLFVDTGLLRQGEREYVKQSIEAIGAKLTVMDEADRFLGNLAGVYEPEKKREIIGNTFLDVQRDFFQNHLGIAERTADSGQRTEKGGLEDSQKQEVQGNGEARSETYENIRRTSTGADDAEIRSFSESSEWILAQGTIYPDTIETGGTKNSVTIKTHHNRVPEIQKMIDEGKVVEPLADLYKDEVRALGELMGLPHELVWRHPFPGPGLGVRILCNDQAQTNLPIVPSECGKYAALPLKSVGVQGDFRTYKAPGMLFLKDLKGASLSDFESLSTLLINQNDDINRCLKLLAVNFDENIESVSSIKCDTNPERVARLQRADHIVTQTLLEMDLYNNIWQFPVVLAPINFNRKAQESIILRPIDSIDAMSATVGKLPTEFFERVAEQILEDSSISAVFLDVTSKPPGTIEWE